jgi:hypothetical protein
MALRALAATILVGAALPGTAQATLSVSRFAVTPSTTKADGHPNLTMSFALGEPSTGVKDIAIHLPAGLSAAPRAIPYCSHYRLVRNLCASRSGAGSLTVTVVAFGLDLSVRRDIFNIKPIATERVRLGVPILGSYSGPGIAAELPVTERPSDKGLDMAVTGLPSEVGGYPVRLKEVTVSLRGTVRTRVRKKVRTKAVLTNPRSCVPATSVLEVTPRDIGAAPLTSYSSFTPSGCATPPQA